YRDRASSSSRVLPIPAGPETSSTPPRPAPVASSRSSTSPSSGPRPTNARLPCTGLSIAVSASTEVRIAEPADRRRRQEANPNHREEPAMQATVHLVDGVAGPHDNSWVDAVLAHLDRPAGALVAFGAAETAGFTAGPVSVRPGTAYEIADQRAGRGRGPARYLQVTTFAGRSPEWCAAFDRSIAERGWPAVQDVPGLVAGLLGSTSDGGRIALTLAESIETL